MRKLSQQERAVYGTCRACGAIHGEACKADVSGPMDFGAHRTRFHFAPTEVEDEGGQDQPEKSPEGAGPWVCYVDGLKKVKESGPEWTAETRLMLVMATSAFMQSAFMSGIPYGMHGVPNMQTLLELGGMSADELEGVRDSIVGDIDDLLLPFFIEGKLPEMPDSRALPYEGFEDEGAASIVSKMVDTGAALRGILDGIKAGKEKGEATAAEVELVEDISDGFALVKEICADAAVKLLQLDEVRWPDSPKVKGAVVFGAQLAGLDLKGLSITVK